MGTFTGNIIMTLRPARRPGDQLGNCEECGSAMNEAFIAQYMRVYKRDNGELYTGAYHGGVYGHKSCLDRFGPFSKIPS